jgi:hypothetical protein
MKKIIGIIATLSILMFALLNSCSKDNSIFNNNKNKPPLANAGYDQVTVLPKDSVALNGEGSSDPDGKISAYQWTKISGPSSFNIVSPTVANTMVRSLEVGIYQFQLAVRDNIGATDVDTVQIRVINGNGSNQQPVAIAGADLEMVLPLNSCGLSGAASYDPDGTITAYQWTKIYGPLTYNMSGANTAVASVTNLVEGYYRFELVVTDNGGLVGKDTVMVSVYASAPTSCNISNRSVNNYGLTEVGFLSEARTPAIAGGGDKILFAGGITPGNNVSAVVDIYNTSNKTWSTAQLSQPRGAISAFNYGSKIYFAGGSHLSATFDEVYDNVDIYDVVTGIWTVAHLSTPRAEIATAAIGNKIFFAGGTPNWWQGSSRIDIYDTLTNQWSTAELSEQKMYVSAVTAGNKIYFAGGEDLGQAYQGIDIYDDNSKQWSTSTLNSLLGGGISGAAIGSTIYWAGPVATGNNNWIERAEVWNTTDNSVTYNCLCFTRYFPQAFARNNEVAFFGWASTSGVTNRFDIFNAQNNTWSIGMINLALNGPAIVQFNNTIYMAGGSLNAAQTNKVFTLNW